MPFPQLIQRQTIPAALAVAVLAGGAALPSLAAPLVPATAHLVPVATGLDNPRHMHFGKDGALYVAEAGRGGGPNAPLQFPGMQGATQYYGTTGAVTRISPDGTSRIVTGLPSAANADGSSAIGPVDVYSDRGLYVLVGGFDPTTRATLAASDKTAQYFNDLLLVLSGSDRHHWVTFADLGAYEQANNLDGLEVNSDPYGLAVLPGNDDTLPFNPHFVVADAGGNDVLDVAHIDDILPLGVFGLRNVPFMGQTIPMEAVPTSIVVSRTGVVYVTQLTGFPFPVGGANIYVVKAGHDPEVVLGGFTNIISMAAAPGGDLYVLDLTTNGLAGPTGPGAGALYRVSLKGAKPTKTLVLSDGLSFPTAVAVSHDGAVYVTNHGTSAGTGEVDRVY